MVTPIQKFAHVQRIINEAQVKYDCMKQWNYSIFEKKSRAEQLEQMRQVINRLIKYSYKQLELL